MKNKTRVSFWATRGGDWIDKRMKKIHDDLLKVEDKISKLRDEIFNMGTEPEKVNFRMRSYQKKYKT